MSALKQLLEPAVITGTGIILPNLDTTDERYWLIARFDTVGRHDRVTIQLDDDSVEQQRRWFNQRAILLVSVTEHHQHDSNGGRHDYSEVIVLDEAGDRLTVHVYGRPTRI